jgi:hypothetical protein
MSGYTLLGGEDFVQLALQYFIEMIKGRMELTFLVSFVMVEINKGRHVRTCLDVEVLLNLALKLSC